MKLFYTSLGIFILLITTLVITGIAFENPDKTSQRLMIDYWYIYLGSVFATVLGIFFLQKGSKDDRII